MIAECNASAVASSPIAPGGTGTWTAYGGCSVNAGSEYTVSGSFSSLETPNGFMGTSDSGTFIASQQLGNHYFFGFSPAAGSPFSISVLRNADNFDMGSESGIAAGTKPLWGIPYTVGEPTPQVQFKCSNANRCEACTQAEINNGLCTGGASCSFVNDSCGLPPPDYFKCSQNMCSVCSVIDINNGSCDFNSECSADGQSCGSPCVGSQCSSPGTYSITASPNPVQVCAPATSGQTTLSWNAPAGQTVDIYRGGTRILQNRPATGNTTQTISNTTTFYVRPAGQTTGGASTTVTPTQNNCDSNGGINIGWDDSYQTKNKTVNIPPSVNETLYVTTGEEKGCSISGSLSINPVSYSSYAVNNVPAAFYTYTLSCPRVPQSVSATLTVNNIAQSFNCSDNSCQLCGGTGIPCDGTGSGCTGEGQRCTTPPLETRWRCAGSAGTPCTQITCQGAACDGTYTSKSGCEDATQCSTTPPPPTLGAQCDLVTVSPLRIVSGRSVSVVPTFRNMGSTAWSSGSFSARIIGATNGWPSPATVFVTSLVAGAPTYGTFSPAFTFIAPSVTVPTSYPFSVSMFSGTTAFSDVCSVVVNGGPIIVYPPQCSDGIDNDDSEDTLADNFDPACIRNGTYDPNWDNERDPSPDAVLRISANPQLVRQGGRSIVTYEVNSCTVVDSEGNRVSAPWTITVDGASTGRSGTGDSGGVQTIDVLDIQTRLTYTLSCGGTSRSATISVIKINEF